MKHLARFIILALTVLLLLPLDAEGQVVKLADRFEYEYQGPTYIGSGASRQKVWYKLTYKHTNRTKNLKTNQISESGRIYVGKVEHRREDAPDLGDRPRSYYKDATYAKDTYLEAGKRYGIFTRTYYDYRIEEGQWKPYIVRYEDVRKYLGEAPAPPPPPPPPDPQPTDPPPDPQPPDPQLPDRPVAEVWQNRRYLTVKNNTSEKLIVYVVYKTVVEGNWVWLPGEPGDTDNALRYEVEPGATDDFEDANSNRIAGSRIRIWAESADGERKWDKFKTNDCWMVPDDGAGQRRYRSSTIGDFTFTFN